MRRSFSSLIVLVAAFTSIGVTGCANDASNVRSVAKSFIDASVRNDDAAVQKVVTKKASSFFASGHDSPTGKHDSNAEIMVGEAIVKENVATVPVSVTDSDGTDEVHLRLRREEGNWRVYAMEMPTIPGAPTVTMDFENPMAIVPDAMHATGVVLGQLARGMEKGANEFARGFDQGYGKPVLSPSSSPAPGAVVEEVPSPPTISK